MKRPSFQFYPTDWLSDYKVASMTPAQRGGYIQTLCHMWNTDSCSLPNDEGLWQSLSGLTGEDLRVVQGCFNQSPTNVQVLVHKRLNQERQKQDFWRQKSIEGGKKSGEKRRNKAKLKGGSRVVEPKGNHSVSSSSTTSTTLSSTLINNAKALQPLAEGTKVEYGNKEINEMLSTLKHVIGIDAFADSSIERNFGKHFISLVRKIGVPELRRRLDILLADSFHQKNCNKIKYIYNNIKGFIEPRGSVTIIH